MAIHTKLNSRFKSKRMRRVNKNMNSIIQDGGFRYFMKRPNTKPIYSQPKILTNLEKKVARATKKSNNLTTKLEKQFSKRTQYGNEYEKLLRKYVTKNKGTKNPQAQPYELRFAKIVADSARKKIYQTSKQLHKKVNPEMYAAEEKLKLYLKALPSAVNNLRTITGSPVSKTNEINGYIRVNAYTEPN